MNKKLKHLLLVSSLLGQSMIMATGLPVNSGTYVFDIKNKVNISVCKREHPNNLELCNLNLSLTDFARERRTGEESDAVLGFVPFYNDVKNLFYKVGGASEDGVYYWPKYVDKNLKLAIDAVAIDTYEKMMTSGELKFESREEAISFAHEKLQENVINFVANPNLTDKQRNFIIMTALTHINKMVKVNSQNIVELDKSKADKLKENLEGREPTSLYGSILSDELDHNIDKVNTGLKEESLEKAKRAIQSSLMAEIGNSEEYKAINEQIDKLKNSPGDHREEIKKLESKREELIKSASQDQEEFNYRAKLYQEAGHATTIAGVFLALTGNPEAQRAVNVAQNAIKAAQAIDTILNADLAGQMAGASTLGPYAVLAVAVFNIFQSFQKKGPSVEEVILQQIQKLSELMIDIHKSLNSRFDRLEYILDQSVYVLLKNFQNIHYRLNDIDDAIAEMSRILDRVENKIDILSINNDENFSEELIDDYRKTARFIFDYDKYHPGQIPSLNEVEEAAQSFHTMAIDYSRRSALAGHGQTPIDKTLTFSRVHEFHINSLAKSNLLNGLSTSSRMPNPYAWNQGVESFLNLYYLYPQYQQDIGIGYFEDLYNTGLEIKDFTEGLARNRKVYRPLFNDYDQNLNLLKQIIQKNVNELLSRKFVDTIKDQNRKVAKQLEAQYRNMAGGLNKVSVENINEHEKSIDQFDINRLNAARSLLKGEEFVTNDEIRFLYPDKIMNSCDPNKSYQINEPLLLPAHLIYQNVARDNLIAEILGGSPIQYCYELEAGAVEYALIKKPFGITIHSPILRKVRKLKIRAYYEKKENVISYFENSINSNVNTPIYPTGKHIEHNTMNYNGPFYGLAAVWLSRSKLIYWPTFLAEFHKTYKEKKLSSYPNPSFSVLAQGQYSLPNLKDNIVREQNNLKASYKNEIRKKIDQSQLMNTFDNQSVMLDYLNYFALNRKYLNDLEFRVKLASKEGLLNSNNLNFHLSNLFDSYSPTAYFEELEQNSVNLKKEIYLSLRKKENTDYYLVSETLKLLEEEIKIKKENTNEL